VLQNVTTYTVFPGSYSNSNETLNDIRYCGGYTGWTDCNCSNHEY
jgi:hypothetical protein